LNSICVDDTIKVNAGWEFTQENPIYNGVSSSGGVATAQFYYKLRV